MKVKFYLATIQEPREESGYEIWGKFRPQFREIFMKYCAILPKFHITHIVTKTMVGKRVEMKLLQYEIVAKYLKNKSCGIPRN
jgi:hypothetical protein